MRYRKKTGLQTDEIDLEAGMQTDCSWRCYNCSGSSNGRKLRSGPSNACQPIHNARLLRGPGYSFGRGEDRAVLTPTVIIGLAGVTVIETNPAPESFVKVLDAGPLLLQPMKPFKSAASTAINAI